MAPEITWDDLDDSERKQLVVVNNGNIRHMKPHDSHRRARARLRSLGLIEWRDRRWQPTPAGKDLARTRSKDTE